jgi:putative ABC transport system permease protein
LNVIALAFFAAQFSEMGGLPPSSVAYTPLWLPLFAIAFATLVGLISCLYPSLRAATMVPVAALKYE